MKPDAPRSRDGSLQGKRVVVTRPEDGAGGLADQLRAHGAVVIELPLVRIAHPADPAPLQNAAAQLASYDWVVFTSANAVHALRDALTACGAPEKSRRTLVAAVGPATAAAVAEELGWSVAVVPEDFGSDTVTTTMQTVDTLSGRRVLWPRAAAARPIVLRDLEAAGARVDAPEAYRTIEDREAGAELARRVSAGLIDVITFTSPSAVQCYAAAGGATDDVRVAVIGPTTAAAARAAGFRVHVQPAEHTISGLVDALAQHLLTER